MGDDNGPEKVSRIRQIVRLREFLHKWQSATIKSKTQEGTSASGIPPAVNKRLKNLPCDSDEEGCPSPEPPPDVPKGYMPVYVGPEQRRFVIPTAYLGLSTFKFLLEKAEDEFGFDNQGALMIPCDIETFKYILQVMDKNQKGLVDDEGNPTVLEEGGTRLEEGSESDIFKNLKG